MISTVYGMSIPHTPHRYWEWQVEKIFFPKPLSRIRFSRNDPPSKPAEDGEWDILVTCNIPIDLLLGSAIRANTALKLIGETMFETLTYQPDQVRNTETITPLREGSREMDRGAGDMVILPRICPYAITAIHRNISNWPSTHDQLNTS